MKAIRILTLITALLCAAALWAMSGVSSAANLIVNADFSAGATSFSSAYTNKTAVVGNQALYDTGSYAITSNPNLKHDQAASYFDHTSGNASGAMLAANGSGVAGTVVWEQVVTVTPATLYDFSAWLSSWISANPATMNFTVNGSTIGSLAANGGTQWVEFVSTWNSGASTTATIRIVNTNTAGGGNDFALDDLYFGIQLPRLTSVAPNTGLTAGGTAVTLTGTGFTGATNVTFGGTAATNRVVVNSTTITCTTPAGTAGAKSVLVTTPAGTNAANTLFTYVAPPTLTSVSPNSGSTAGGSAVTLTGTGFTGATNVTFGGTAATNRVVVNATTITCTTPARAAGTASVVVTTPAGTNVANSLYTYVIPAVYGAAPNFLAGTQPVSVAVDDFNGDGKRDLAVANFGSINVSIRLGTGTGSFGTATNFPVGTNPSSVAVGDFNGDGKRDLAVANYGSNNVSTLLGTGTGSFGAATNSLVGTNPVWAAVGDLNGDGKHDLAVTNYNSSNVSIQLGTGTGSFGASTNFAVGTKPRHVAVSDFNGDGKPDLAVVNETTNNASILLGTGTGSFGAATNFAVGTTPYAVAVGDFDGDGKLDLAVANFGSNNVSILLGNGAGSFGAATNSPVGTAPRSVAVGDFNGDGKSDLAVANHDSNNLSILLNLTVPATTVTAISPTSGSTAGGTAVTITGTGFTGATKVTFGGTAATILTVTATSITCTTPARAAGTAGVAVTTPGGTNAANTLFTYVGPLSSSKLTTAAYTGTDPTLNDGVLYGFPIVSDSQAAPATLTITSTSAGTVLSGNSAVVGNNINTGFRTNVNLTLNPGESVVAQTISLTTGQFDDGLRLDYNGLKVLDFDFSNWNNAAVNSMFGGAWTPWTNEGSPAMEMEAGGLRLMVTATSNGTGAAAGVIAGSRINLLDYFTADAYVRYPVNPDFVSGVQIALYSRNNQGAWAISNATLTATARVIKNTPTGLASLATGTGQQINTTWFRDAQNGFIGTDGGGVRVTNNGGQTWTASNTGVTNNIYAIRQVDGVLFLAGADGLICRSTNNGGIWTTQATGTTATFRGLAFSSATRGFAVGTGGTICIYNGTTWVAQNSGTTADFSEVSVVGTTAWAVGAGGVICFYNGTSWVPVNSGVTGIFYSVSFLRANLGFAVGANGLLCRYNGTAWQQVPTGVTITWRSVFVADENTIVISGDGGMICQSTDGGQTWLTLSVGSSAVLTTVGVAGGQVRVFGTGGAGYAFTVLLPTGLVSLDTGTERQINTTWFSDVQNGFMGTDGGGVRVTNNGGETWTTSNTGVPNNIYAIRKVGTVAFLAGANGLICRSTDNGATWTAQTTNTPATFRALAFSSTTRGFAVGTGGTICIYNGTTWVAQNTGTTKEFTGVSIVGTTAWAVGAGGIICRYNGTSWVQVASGVTDNFYGVAFLRENLGFAVGAGGLLCRYNGTSWVAVNTGVTTAFRSVVIVDENTIVISGDGGLICQSTDGGLTWQTLSVGSSVSLTSLALAGGQVRAFGTGGAGFAFSVSLLPPPPFRITAFSYNPTARTVNLTFDSEPAVNYTIETSLNGQTWTVLGAPVPGAAGATSTTVTNRPLQPPYTDRLMLRVRRP